MDAHNNFQNRSLLKIIAFMQVIQIATNQKQMITLDSTSGSNYFRLPISTLPSVPGYAELQREVVVSRLGALAYVTSLPKVQYPVPQLTDTNEAITQQVVALEWASPRVHLELTYSDTATPNTKHLIREYALLNVAPYPYREYDYGEHYLGSNGILWFRIKDVGYGVLSRDSFEDKVIIQADIQINRTLIETVKQTVKQTRILSGNQSVLLASNVNRSGATFYNTSTDGIAYLDISDAISQQSYMVKIEAGDYYELPHPAYTGDIFGLASKPNTALEVREFS